MNDSGGNNQSIFTCSKCGAKHPAIRVEYGLDWKNFSKTGATARRHARILMELRTRWHMATDKLFSPEMEMAQNLPPEDRPKNYDAIVLAEINACSIYLQHKRQDTIWLVPESISFVKRKFICTEKCNE